MSLPSDSQKEGISTISQTQRSVITTKKWTSIRQLSPAITVEHAVVVCSGSHFMTTHNVKRRRNSKELYNTVHPLVCKTTCKEDYTGQEVCTQKCERQ